MKDPDQTLAILLEMYDALVDLDRRSLTAGDKGDVIVAGSGPTTTLTIDAAYRRARIEDAKAIASFHP